MSERRTVRRPGRARRRRAALVACPLALVLLASCQPGAAPAGPGGRVRAGTVVVASFNFPESELLAAIYGMAIQHAGIPVRLRLNLGPRELVQPALEQGLVNLVPEYLGTALTSIGPHPSISMSIRRRSGPRWPAHWPYGGGSRPGLRTRTAWWSLALPRHGCTCGP